MMKKLTMLLVAALAAATVATGANAAAPPPPEPNQQRPCRLVTSLGLMIYQHMDQITVIGSDHKEHKYLCFDAHWIELRTAPTPTGTPTYTGSFSTVLTRI
jgi:hypothetical protein